MKLFLASKAISETQAPHFIKLVGKPPGGIRFALIENAADVEEGPNEWLYDNRKQISAHGFDIELLDLREYKGKKQGLEQKLASKDVLWVGGGNTYYLRWLLRETGADEMIKRLVARGTIYGGGSAGAIVAGPTLAYFEAADDSTDVPEVISEGLRLTDLVVLPHVDNKKFAHVMHTIKNNLQQAGFKTVPLTDAQALVVNGDMQEIVG